MLSAFLLVLIAVCFSVGGEFFLKAGMDRVGVITLSALSVLIPKMIRTWQLYAGLGLIGTGALFWLAAISRVDLSWAYPMLAMGYLLTLIFAPLLLREQVPLIRWVGALVIVVGIYLISRS